MGRNRTTAASSNNRRKHNTENNPSDNGFSNSSTLKEIKASGHFKNALFTSDKCRNNEIPCCNIIREICSDILPDVYVNELDIESKQGKKNGVDTDNSSIDEIESKDVVGENDISSESSKKQFNQKERKASSLLSQMVRQYLLDERKRSFDGSICYTRINPSQGTSNETSYGENKKKKRRKKKKKNSNASGTSTTDTTTPKTTFSSSLSEIITVNSPLNEDTNTYLGSTHEMKTSPIPHESNEQGLTSWVENPLQNESTEEDTNQTDIDLLNKSLDQILNTESSTTTNLSPPKNRSLESLFEYIHCKYQSSQTSTSNKKYKTKSNDYTPASKRPPNLWIPVRELTDCICDNMKCIPCKRDTEQFLDEISKNARTKSCAVEWGDAFYQNIEELGESGSSKKEDDKNAVDEYQERGLELMNVIYLNSNGIAITEKKKNSTLGLTYSPYGLISNDNSFNLDNTFDYALMEEGNGGAATMASNSKDECDSEKGIKLNIVKGKDNGAKYFELCSSDCPITISKFMKLVKDVILPCGLKEPKKSGSSLTSGIDHEDSVVSDQTYRAIQYQHEGKLKEFNECLMKLGTALHEMTNYYDQSIANKGSPLQFDVKGTQALRNCEEKQLEYIYLMYDFLREIHSSTSCTRVIQHKEQKWLCNLIDGLWELYEGTVKSFIAPSLEYVWKIVQLDSKYSAYNCPTRRSYMTEMLKRKLESIEKFQYELLDILKKSSPTEGQDNMSRVVALTTYFHSKVQDCSVSALKQPLEEIVVKKQYQIVCTSNRKPETSQIIIDHSHQIVNLREASKRLANEFDSCKIQNEDTLSKKYHDIWTANKIMIEDKFIDDERLKKSEHERSLESDLHEVTNLFALADHVCKHCRIQEDLHSFHFLRGFKGGDCTAMKFPKWLEKINFTRNPTAEMKVPGKCHGDGGQRRVVSILSSCVYSWVLERTLEWHADLTHAELLMDEDLLFENQSKSATTTTKSKKAKKKKKKGSSKKEISVDIETEDRRDENEYEEVQELIAKEAIDRNSNNIANDHASNSSDDPANNFENIHENTLTKDSAKSPNGRNEPSIETDQPKDDFDHYAFDGGNSNVNDFEDYFVNIFVYDKKSQTPVDDYLCDRFIEVLENEEFLVI